MINYQIPSFFGWTKCLLKINMFLLILTHQRRNSGTELTLIHTCSDFFSLHITRKRSKGIQEMPHICLKMTIYNHWVQRYSCIEAADIMKSHFNFDRLFSRTVQRRNNFFFKISIYEQFCFIVFGGITGQLGNSILLHVCLTVLQTFVHVHILCGYVLVFLNR